MIGDRTMRALLFLEAVGFLLTCIIVSGGIWWAVWYALDYTMTHEVVDKPEGE